MPSTKPYRILHDKVMARPGAAERIARHREETLKEIGLYELRQAQTLSQADLAGRLDVTQSAISKLEHAEDWRLSTLQHYVQGLGGELEIQARIGGKAFPLKLGTKPERARRLTP